MARATVREVGITRLEDARLIARLIDKFESASGEDKLIIAYALMGIKERYNLDGYGMIEDAESFLDDWKWEGTIE